MSKKVIYVDGSALIRNSHGGIAHYTAALIEQIEKNSHYDVRVLLFKGEAAPVDAACEILPFPRKLYMGLWRLIPFLNVSSYLKHKPHAVIYPNFAMAPYVKLRGCKTITAIHDLTYMHYPKTVEWKNRLFLQLAVRRSCRYSDAIIATSQYTLDDITKQYTIAGTSAVAYPGFDPLHTSGVVRDKVTALTATPFLLFIGTIEPRKNITALCEAFLQSHFYKKGYALVIAGGKGWGTVAIANNPRIIRIGRISDNERSYLLAHAKAFVFPSLFEGFGMPVVEAMASGIPVVTTNSSSLKEIVSSDGAFIIQPPYGPPEILAQLNLLYDEVSQQGNVTAKINHAKKESKKYTWENCFAVYSRFL